MTTKNILTSELVTSSTPSWSSWQNTENKGALLMTMLLNNLWMFTLGGTEAKIIAISDKSASQWLHQTSNNNDVNSCNECILNLDQRIDNLDILSGCIDSSKREVPLKISYYDIFFKSIIFTQTHSIWLLWSSKIMELLL